MATTGWTEPETPQGGRAPAAPWWLGPATVITAAALVLLGYIVEFGYGAVTNLISPAGEPSHAIPVAQIITNLFWRWCQSWALLLGHFTYYLHNANHTGWMPWLMLAIGSSVIAAGTWRTHHDTPLDRTGHSRIAT